MSPPRKTLLQILAVVVFTTAAAASAGSSDSDCSYSSLLAFLNLTSTNEVLATVRPVRNWTTPTMVLMDMVLYGILEVDEKFQTVTSHIWISKRWQNEFLTWNPSDFCGIKVLTVPRSKLWIPEVNIQEDASDSSSVQESSVLSVYSNGWILANTRQRLTSTCWLNLMLFPFDSQSCKITFASMTSTAETLTLGTGLDDSLLTEISENIMVTQGEWQLEKMLVNLSDYKGVSNLIYTVVLTRKPMLYIINLIVPLFFFVVLDLSSFFISEFRGEKLSFKVTVLLSISVLLLILKDMLPSTEDKLPMIATYCTVIFVMVGVSLLEAILVSFLFDLDDGCCCGSTENDHKHEDDVQTDVQLNTVTESEDVDEPSEKLPPRVDDHFLFSRILQEVTSLRQEAAGRLNADQKKPKRFRRAAEIIDRVFFTFYFLMLCVFLLYMNITWISKIKLN